MRCVAGKLETTVLDAVGLLDDVTGADEPAIHLAVSYARIIDAEPLAAAKVGPMLLACLEALLMTPRARAAIIKGARDVQRETRSPLDELRQRRAARRG